MKQAMPLFESQEDLLPFRDQSYRNYPYPFYDKIRPHGDVYRHPMGMYVVTKYEHVAQLLRDRTLSVLQIDFGPATALHDSMLGQDMPDHTRLRRATNEWFAPAAVKELTDEIRVGINRIFDDVQKRGSFEAVYDLAYPLTHSLMCRILDVPFDGSTDVRDKTFDFGLSLGPGASDEDLEKTAAASDWFVVYIKGLIAEKRSNPGHGMLDAMIELLDQNEMSEAEVIATTFLFFAVGHLDVSYLITNGLRIFAENKNALKIYRDEPEKRTQIINEILRFDTPEQFVSRLTTQPTLIGDFEVPAGEMLILMIGAANKDPEMFTNPHNFDPERLNSGRHLAFSGGMHGCVGQILARAEAEEVFNTVVQRFPNMSLDGVPTWGHTEFLRAMHSLPLRIN
jgi:cytochrome P450